MNQEKGRTELVHSARFRDLEGAEFRRDSFSARLGVETGLLGRLSSEYYPVRINSRLV